MKVRCLSWSPPMRIGKAGCYDRVWGLGTRGPGWRWVLGTRGYGSGGWRSGEWGSGNKGLWWSQKAGRLGARVSGGLQVW